MTVVRVTLLLLGLLLAAHCDVRARDPEVEEEEEAREDLNDRDWQRSISPGGFGAPHHRRLPHGPRPEIPGDPHPPVGHGHPQMDDGHGSFGPSGETVDHSAEAGAHNYPTRTGNWCAFVHRRVITMAVSCGTEKYTIQSQSPCPNGTPDCQLVMYKLSTRPVYREKQKVVTALLWRCCPGHGGENCEETVSDGQVPDSVNPALTERSYPGVERQTHLSRNQNWEQNDYQVSSGELYEARQPEPENDTATETRDYYEHSDHSGHDHQQNHDSERADTVGILPMHHVTALLMSQLQPVLDGFNRTLQRLSLEVQDLQRDMTYLRLREMEELPPDGLDDKDKVDDTLQELEKVKGLLLSQHFELEDKLHAMQATLQYNLTNFKTDVDVKMKRNQKTLQVSLQAFNSSLSEVKQDQVHLEEMLRGGWRPEKDTFIPSQPQGNSAIWEAITRLDNKVVNNTVRLNALVEEQDLVSGNIRYLQDGFRGLAANITQTGRNSQIQFMETGLEVEAAKVAVLDRINELGSNITILQETMESTETDVDYLYRLVYKNISNARGSCDCMALSASITHLERALANVTEIANENRLVLDGEADTTLENWGEGGWVEDLKLGLLHVQHSLALEQEKSRVLQLNVSNLQSMLVGSQQEIGVLQEQDRLKAEEIKNLRGSFDSLLEDAIRHTEVLSILLEVEVLEFTELPSTKKMTFSIPALQDSIRNIQEQIKEHSLSLASLQKAPVAEDTVADEPSVLADWASVGLKRRRGDEKFDYLPEEHSDYSDRELWALGRSIEGIGVRVSKLEERPCACLNQNMPRETELHLQKELALLRRSLEDHLQMFERLFSNTEGLSGSDATLDLDKLSTMMSRKEAKQQRKKQKRIQHLKDSQSGHQANFRSRRDASLESSVLRQLPDSPLMFLASGGDGANGAGPIVFERVSLNRGQMYSQKTGTFQAPAAGIYLFVLTLDFGPGPSFAQLRRGEEVVATMHQSQRKPAGPATRVCLLQLDQGEQLYLELVQGTLERSKPKDNTFSGLLLLHST
ncbi:multimerin-2a [Chanos chanos]|uniref:Multimerin-2a n=1 Tax=Chanos chanos TaxID=29144 RepID=A0A6J2V4U2_CHACN|nr:multimerin-2-like [Chanos chanos]